MGPDGPREQIEDVIARLGCEIRERGDGSCCVDCPSHAAKVGLLDALAWRDARYDPRVRDVAVAIAKGAATTTQHKVDPLDLARRLHSYVTHNVRYLGEGAETFQNTRTTLATGMGDCDDSSRALLALARTVAIPARLVVFDKSKPGAEDLEPNHATVQLAPDGKTWLYAETSLGPAVQLGEHPIAAARRLRAKRTDIGAELGAVGGDVAARPIIVQAWQNVLGRPPTTFEAQMTGAIASLESGYGTWPGAGANSHNWGAVQCPSGSVEGPGCFAHQDTKQDGTPYQALFKIYPDDVAGATDLVKNLTTQRPATRAALAAGVSVWSVSNAMYRERYYGSYCPQAIKSFGAAATTNSAWGAATNNPAAGRACDAEAIGLHANTAYKIAVRIAQEMNEPAPSLGAPWLPILSTAQKVLIAAGVGGALYLVAAHQKWLPSSFPSPF